MLEPWNDFAYGVLMFSSRTRRGSVGVPFRFLLQQQQQRSSPSCEHSSSRGRGRRYFVDVRSENDPRRRRVEDAWAKVCVVNDEDTEDDDAIKLELVELLGPIGDRDLEQRVSMYAFRILPCTYPPRCDVVLSRSPRTTSLDDVIEITTFDGPETTDRDDGFSIHRCGDDVVELGIHITDTTVLFDDDTAKKGEADLLWAWIRDRTSSAYPSCSRAPLHMLPPWALDRVNLEASSHRDTIAVFLEVSLQADPDVQEVILNTRIQRCRGVHVVENATYEQLDAEPRFSLLRQTLSKIYYDVTTSATTTTMVASPEDLVAEAMITYNLVLSTRHQQSSGNKIMFRVKPTPETRASYSFDPTLGHCHFRARGPAYAQFTSPMRRFPDAYNQRCVTEPRRAPTDVDIDAVNAHMSRIQRFHSQDAAMSLAYACRASPMSIHVARCSLDPSRNGCLRIEFGGRRYRVDIDDSYFAEDIRRDLFLKHETEEEVELCGVIVHSRARLRLRLKSSSEEVSSSSAFVYTSSRGAVDDEEAAASSTSLDRGRKRIERALNNGCTLDGFQMEALGVILAGKDLLGMAPTGSGKTVLALMGILLRAFDRNKKAILTTPVKALSNQKFSEFRAILGDGAAAVSLFTGDVQIRATSSSSLELIIMTTEILEQKLRAQMMISRDDDDLADLAVVVMDEIHYINDADRGGIWERVIMMLPKHVQMISLSATLREPVLLRDWLSTRRPTVLVDRPDRHVPLHVGVLRSEGSGAKGGGGGTGAGGVVFEELYCTSNPGSWTRGAVYDEVKRTCWAPRNSDILLTARTLVRHLDALDMLPAIVFGFSRDACVKRADEITHNLLLPPRPVQAEEEDDYAFAWRCEQHMEKVEDVRRRQHACVQEFLLPYRPLLDCVPGFYEFHRMLERGVAYHHAGMLPILRELVEVLFQRRLIRVVFATETLGVGINMPARTTVFTGLEKPCSSGGARRQLRSDEFWQMAGRSGRRGMDVLGYVVYQPIVATRGGACVIGSANDLREVLLGSLPPVVSKLKITPSFVLRQTMSRRSAGDLNNSFMQFQTDRRIRYLMASSSSLASSEGEEELDPKVIEEYLSLKRTGISMAVTEDFGVCLRPSPKQRKVAQQKMAKLEVSYPLLKETEFLERYARRKEVLAEIEADREELRERWATCIDYLIAVGFLNREGGDSDVGGGSILVPSLKGRVCASFSDQGSPEVRAMILASGRHFVLPSGGADVDPAWSTFQSVLIWLAGFTEPVHVDPFSMSRLDLPLDLIEDTEQAFVFLQRVGRGGGGEGGSFSHTNAFLMQTWLESSADLCHIVGTVNFHGLGEFVKMVLRTVNYVDETTTALLGLAMYELHEMITTESYRARVMCGLVNNASLYVR